MNRLMGLPDAAVSSDGYLAIMVRQSQRRLALVVDHVEGESEVVVRDLGKYLGKVQLFMGSTILGTGDVALLLDVYDLVSAVRMRTDVAPETVGAGDCPAVDADVLVVEDSLLVREMQQRVLTSAGYRVDTASSGKTALELLSRKRFHAVVAGARMPGMDGIELLSQARQADHTRDVPFILVAPPENRADLVRGMAAGAQAFVTSDDFTAERLTATIGRVVCRGRRK
jgi:CheY-like chemotaxis protein